MSLLKAYDGVKADVFAAGAMLFRMLFDAHTSTDTLSFRNKFKRLILEEKVAEEIGLEKLEWYIPDGEKVTHFITREAPSASSLSLRG